MRDGVHLLPNMVRCWLGKSKTDQEGRGCWIELHELPGSLSCPVRSLREFLLVRPVGPRPLLVHQDGSFLSRYQFVAVFRKCLMALGLCASKYSSHSFRIGAATEAARWGLGPSTIQRIGRWESNRYRSYVRPHLVEV